MAIYIGWLVKLILAHLLTDFVLQPSAWIVSRRQKHFSSKHLYLHALLTAVIALVFIGFSYWLVGLAILVTHLLIDGWKSYQPVNISYFLLDQLLHFIVLGACWYFTFFSWTDVRYAWQQANTSSTWILITSMVFLTQPCAILIGQLTNKWRQQIPESDSLGSAGKWIGIVERIIILVLVLNQQYASVGLLITGKSLLRFNEPNRLEAKTEYLLIGTLISFSIAIVTGILARSLMHL